MYQCLPTFFYTCKKKLFDLVMMTPFVQTVAITTSLQCHHLLTRPYLTCEHGKARLVGEGGARVAESTIIINVGFHSLAYSHGCQPSRIVLQIGVLSYAQSWKQVLKCTFYMYINVLRFPIILVWVLFGIAIPTSPFSKCFFTLVVLCNSMLFSCIGINSNSDTG